MTQHPGDEQTIWEGEAHNLAAKITGGRLVLRYRLTDQYLHYETGGYPSHPEQLSLLHVEEVRVSQTFMQRAKNTGNIAVKFIRENSRRETAQLFSVEEPTRVRGLINDAVRRVQAAANLGKDDEVRDRKRVDPAPRAAAPARDPRSVVSSRIDTPDKLVVLLNQLGELRKAGILSDEEFEAKKKQLLDRL